MSQQAIVSPSSKQAGKSKKQWLFVMVGSILSTSITLEIRRMSLSLDNYLPSKFVRFGTSDDNKATLSCHVDSFVAMNTGNKLLHMWIIKNYPGNVANYEKYDDADAFQSITLDCAVPSTVARNDSGKFSAIVAYKTRYNDASGKIMTLAFGLGGANTVNVIIGGPTIRKWKLVLN